MIVKWNQNCVKVVGSVILLPGNNEVSTPEWQAVRGWVEDEIKAGAITEVGAVTEEVPNPKKGPGGKELPPVKVVKEAPTLSDLNAKEAAGVVKETYNLATLKGWQEVEGRDGVRAAIAKQIDLVEKHGSVQAKDKQDAE